MKYSVIIENKDGIWRAFIPTLAGISAEGESREEVLQHVWREAQIYLAQVEVATIEVQLPPEFLRPGSPESVLRAAGKFKGEEEAMLQHIEEIYAERQREREEYERALDQAETNGTGQ